MTIEELADELGITAKYLYAKWPRVQRTYLEKKNIVLVKVGRGAAAEYGIKGWFDTDVRWEPKEDWEEDDDEEYGEYQFDEDEL